MLMVPVAPSEVLQCELARGIPGQLAIRRHQQIAAQSQRARTRVLHVLDPGRNDHKVMMPTSARYYANQFIRLGVDDGDAAGQALEAAKRT
jgi:hypothetical protein